MKRRKPKMKKTTIILICLLVVAIGIAATVLIVVNINDGAQETSKITTTAQTQEEFDFEIVTEAQETTEAQTTSLPTSNYTKYQNGEEISLNPKWKYADYSAINTGKAVYYKPTSGANGIVIALNAGHGTSGGEKQKTYCHPDKSPKVTGGSTAQGATMATAIATGMSFNDGTKESTATLAMAKILKDKLLADGFEVLMLRDGEDVQLDNISRTVIANNVANCHISLHWDGDSLDYDKGIFYIGVPDGIKNLETVSAVWQKSEALGKSLVDSISAGGYKLYNNGRMEIDLTQTSYSTIPGVDLELGNQCSDLSDSNLNKLADTIVLGIKQYFGYSK